MTLFWQKTAWVSSLLTLAGLFAWGRHTSANDEKPVTKRALVICGLPGDDDHRTAYAKAVEKIVAALITNHGFTPSEVLVRFGDEKKDGDGAALKACRGLSDRAGIEADVAELKKRLQPEDTLWVIVVGHAHFDGRHSHLNIPGPDLDEKAFGKLFEGLKAKEQVFFLTTSASGFFLKSLAAPGRVVISATEADQEVNETIYHLALADALTTTPADADRDRDGSVSLYEFYLAVALDVLQRYKSDENLPTEHARLDDNGDGHGSELQEDVLPADLGGPEKPKPPRKLGPKDDGHLSSQIRIGPAPAPAAAKEAEKNK